VVTTVNVGQASSLFLPKQKAKGREGKVKPSAPQLNTPLPTKKNISG
jgi:hypothetical protein